jgi:ADP-ribose pyrophosphatase YjhB (NUDIX family)
MEMVECTTHYGKKKLLPKEKLTFRPSVYAIIVNDGNVLLLNTTHTGTYSLPGGGIEIGEPIEDALKREVREETGLEIEIINFYRFEEQFFYYDPGQVAFHSFLFFYVCLPKTIQIRQDIKINDDSVELPRWIKINELENQHFHNHGHLVLEALHSVQ